MGVAEIQLKKMDTVEGLTEKLEKKRERIVELKDEYKAQLYQIQQQQAEMKQLLSLVARHGNRPFLWCLHCSKPTLDRQIYHCVGCFASLPCQEWCKYTYGSGEMGKKMPKRCDHCNKFFCDQCVKNDIRVCSECFKK
jgi:hypothetical protein